MKIIIRHNGDEFNRMATSLVMASMWQDRRVNVSLTGGSSPRGAYEILAKEIRENKKDYQDVHFYGFDNCDHDLYRYGLAESMLVPDLYQPAEIADENIHYLTSENYQSYDREIAAAGGLDFMLIGLGADGHFCGNLPNDTILDRECYVIDISKNENLQAIMSDTYKGSKPSDVCVTMGSISVMRVKQLVMMVNGKHKAEMVKKMIESPVDPGFPSSILKLHPNFILLLDEDAASLLD